MPNSCLPHTWDDPTPVPCSQCGKMLGPGERTAVWGGWLCDEHVEAHRKKCAETEARVTKAGMLVSPAMMKAMDGFGRGLFNPAANVAQQYYDSHKKRADEGDPISKLIVEQSDAIREGKPGPLSGGVRGPCF